MITTLWLSRECRKKVILLHLLKAAVRLNISYVRFIYLFIYLFIHSFILFIMLIFFSGLASSIVIVLCAVFM